MIAWHTIKAVAAHLADWGYQTRTQAITKAHDPYYRSQHVAIVAGSHTVAALTSEGVTTNRRIAYILINTISHYLIDSIKMHKAIDQTLHILVAVLTSKLIEVNYGTNLSRFDESVISSSAQNH